MRIRIWTVYNYFVFILAQRTFEFWKYSDKIRIGSCALLARENDRSLFKNVDDYRVLWGQQNAIFSLAQWLRKSILRTTELFETVERPYSHCVRKQFKNRNVFEKIFLPSICNWRCNFKTSLVIGKSQFQKSSFIGYVFKRCNICYGSQVLSKCLPLWKFINKNECKEKTSFWT